MGASIDDKELSFIVRTMRIPCGLLYYMKYEIDGSVSHESDDENVHAPPIY